MMAYHRSFIFPFLPLYYHILHISDTTLWQQRYKIRMKKSAYMQEFAEIQTKIYSFCVFSLDNSSKMNNFAPVLEKDSIKPNNYG